MQVGPGHADGLHAAHGALAAADHARADLALGLLQLLFRDSFLLDVMQQIQDDGQVLLRPARFATEGRVKRSGPLIIMEARIRGVGQAGIDKRPVQPAARVVTESQGQRVRWVAQRRFDGRPR